MQYSIEGEPFPVVICNLEEGESMITEGGSMVWMTPNMEMQTSGGGSLGKAFGRMFSGDSIFQNIYTARGGAGMIAFGSSFPGKVIPIEITPDRPMVVQKSGFLCSVPTVELSTFFNHKASGGFFSGEGFFNTLITGPGNVSVQSHPASALAQALQPYIVTVN